MEICFPVGEQAVRFSRNWFTDRAMLQAPKGSIDLQLPLDPRTHFSTSLVKSWNYYLDGHDIVVEKTRPLFIAGIRPQNYRVLVDGSIVATAKGY